MILRPYKGTLPQIHKETFIAAGAHIIGQVVIARGVSVWFNAVIRGDMDSIIIDENSNVQDNAVIHVADNAPVKIGKNVTIGHSAVIHGCEIGDNCLIGMNATVLDGAKIGDNCIVGANALVPAGKKIPPRSLVVGVPAKVVRELSEEEIQGLTDHAIKYRALWEEAY